MNLTVAAIAIGSVAAIAQQNAPAKSDDADAAAILAVPGVITPESLAAGERNAKEGGANAKSKLVAATAESAVPAPHQHVLKQVTRADGTVVLTCATEANPAFVAFERERTATQEK